ncbi:translation elongation factor Ts [bacterium M21]|nr:translation elongation factor Ts [bacterium M21]
MAQVTATMVKNLRETTGAGMMDCKRALDEAEGDMDKGVEIIRKMGLAKAAKKAHRTTKEGVVRCVINDDVAVLAEILCETDFVASNANFVAYVDSVVEEAVTGDYAEGDISDAVRETQKDQLGELTASVGENIQIPRAVRWTPTGKVHSYIHDGGGTKIGVMVEIEGDHDEEFGKLMAMHICASNPSYVSPEDVPAEVIEKEKEIAAAQPELASKKPEMIEKILIGKIARYYKDFCLTDQVWCHDDKLQVKKVNPKAKVLRFLRWQLGETQA